MNGFTIYKNIDKKFEIKFYSIIQHYIQRNIHHIFTMREEIKLPYVVPHDFLKMYQF